MAIKQTLTSLLRELQSLAHIPQTVDEDIDWLVDTDSLEDDDIDELQRLGARRVFEDKSALDVGVKENVRGTLETLKERMEGLLDLVDLGKLGPLATGIDKLVKDFESLRDSISSGDKKKKAIDKKKEKESSGQEQDDGQKSSEGAKQKPTAKERAQAQQGPSDGPNQGGGQGGAPQSAGASQGAQGKSEGVTIVGNDVITEASIKDVFGMGDEFKREIARIASGKKVSDVK
jgi:hypothetical protein